jgi:2-polyprenyl-3-methyl-5-hydroxy-6-metoxy-1,4-benzoquinol methylase
MNCIACGNPDATSCLVSKDYNFRIDEKQYTLIKCQNCGLVWLQDPPKDLGRYYGENYHPCPEAANSIVKKVGRVIKINKNLLPKAIFSKKYDKMLEIGCGNGNLMRIILAKYPDAKITGIEMRGKAAKEARASGLDILEGDFFEVAKEIPDATYDVIILDHVFEHLKYPKLALDEFHRLLKPNGEVLITVPNVNGISVRLFGKYAETYDVPRHLFDFTEDALKILAFNSKFATTTKTFSENTFVLPSLMNRLNITREKYYSWRSNKALNLLWILGEFSLSWLALIPDRLGYGDQILAKLEVLK